MASEFLKILSNEKVICESCKKGYLVPKNNDVPKEKATSFICTNCGEEIRIVKKFKI